MPQESSAGDDPVIEAARRIVRARAFAAATEAHAASREAWTEAVRTFAVWKTEPAGRQWDAAKQAFLAANRRLIAAIRHYQQCLAALPVQSRRPRAWRSCRLTRVGRA